MNTLSQMSFMGANWLLNHPCMIFNMFTMIVQKNWLKKKPLYDPTKNSTSSTNWMKGLEAPHIFSHIHFRQSFKYVSPDASFHQSMWNNTNLGTSPIFIPLPTMILFNVKYLRPKVKIIVQFHVRHWTIIFIFGLKYLGFGKVTNYDSSLALSTSFFLVIFPPCTK